MKEDLTSVILHEYYRIVAPLLVYTPCECSRELEGSVLSLLCAAKGCPEAEESCKAMIEKARCLQSTQDGALLLSVDQGESCVAYDIKMDVLTACRIDRTRSFEQTAFIDQLKTLANAGHRNPCKLLAFLSWLGLLLPENKPAALNIWSALAVSGDRTALELLIFGCCEEERQKWTHIAHILHREQEHFSPIASCLSYPDSPREEIELANIILFTSQLDAGKESPLDRPMLHYALHSKDDYTTKMSRLSAKTNYYLVMHAEDTFSQREFGF